jgi:hypothetical protein
LVAVPPGCRASKKILLRSWLPSGQAGFAPLKKPPLHLMDFGIPAFFSVHKTFHAWILLAHSYTPTYNTYIHISMPGKMTLDRVSRDRK